MGNSLKFLSGLLVVQFVFIVLLYRSSDSLEAFKPQEPFYEMDVDSVTRVQVTGKDGDSVVLEKQNENWVLPESAGFPVATDKLDKLVRGVLTSMRSYPVATTKAAHSQLDVGKDDFERHLQFFNGDDKIVDVYLGTSPSFKKLHLRRADEDAVYVVSLNAHDAGVKANYWYDLSALKLKKDNVKEIQFQDLTFKRTDKALELQGVKENEEPVESEVSSLVNRLLGQSFLENLGSEVDKEIKELKKNLSYDVVLSDDAKLTYTFYGPGKDDLYVLRSSKYPHYFKVSKTEVEALKGIERSKLVQEKKAEEVSSVSDTEVEQEASESEK